VLASHGIMQCMHAPQLQLPQAGGITMHHLACLVHLSPDLHENAAFMVVVAVVAAAGVQLLPSHCGEQHHHSLRGSTSHSQQQQPQLAELGCHFQYL
jgi:hypothetical protein